jgi:DNA (cytosine-5)-methyltransferase 1
VGIRNSPEDVNQIMKYMSLFSGIGGFELGIKQAYEDYCSNQGGKTEGEGRILEEEFSFLNGRNSTLPDSSPRRASRREPTCIGYSETDKYAIQIYQKHFPEHKNYGDITRINEAELPDFDLLVGGFPCQSFSIAGKRGGFADTRGTLFFDIARILKHKQPRLFLLENVKGLLSHDKGRTFATIISTLDELGYDLQWQVLNSKNFGVPQNRERVFIVGHLRRTSRPKVFPFGENNKATDEVRTKDSGKNGRDSEGENGWPTERRKLSQSLDSSYWKGPDNHKQRTIITTPKIRRLTPTECERLQGFPDGWTEGVSDTQRYKTLGNAVTVNVITEIIKKI